MAVKLSFENEEGKYEIYISEQSLFRILECDEFKGKSVDAKTLKEYNFHIDIPKALKLEFPKSD